MAIDKLGAEIPKEQLFYNKWQAFIKFRDGLTVSYLTALCVTLKSSTSSVCFPESIAHVEMMINELKKKMGDRAKPYIDVLNEFCLWSGAVSATEMARVFPGNARNGNLEQNTEAESGTLYSIIDSSRRAVTNNANSIAERIKRKNNS